MHVAMRQLAAWRRTAGVAGILALAVSAATALGAPTIDRSDAALNVDLGNGVKLSFALAKGELLGLRTATASGVALKSDQTLVRPVLAQEFGDHPLVYDRLILADAKVDGDTVRLTIDLKARDAATAWPAAFVTKDGKIARDYYGFAHTRLPSEAMRVDTLPQQAQGPAQDKPLGLGTLTWVLTPATENIGGWTWKGWKHHYEFQLANGQKLNTLREFATWELNGQAVGNTLVALRYRGLGGMAAKLEPAEGAPDKNAVRNAFTTTEILPGAVGKAQAVSPIVNVGTNAAMPRADAMAYRQGAWIAHMQRGGGANWVDFQYNPKAALISYYDKMDAIRSLTEVWPGDTQVSYTDDLLFALTDKHTTIDKVHLALVPSAELPEHEWHTRWQEVDQFCRNLISKDLGFVQHDPLPTYGINWDSAWEWQLKSAIGQVDTIASLGYKRVITHQPGWFNGRGLRQKETKFPIPQRMLKDPKKPDQPATLQNDTGGDCSIHDYIPQSDAVATLWKDFAKKLNQKDIEYWVWITGMVYGTSPIVEKFGETRFTRNLPDVNFSHGYPGGPEGRAGHRGISLRDPDIAQWFTQRMDAAVNDLGVSGFWTDSFQNMFMSQMNYQRPDWSPQVREWWIWAAAMTRRGVGFEAESQMFPGLSCNIEVGDTPTDWHGSEWLAPYVVRWFRGTKVAHTGTPEATTMFFRTMANKGPVSTGNSGGPNQIPEHARMAGEYMAALPTMHRSYQLPQDQGVLWLPNDQDENGVLFAFTASELPKDVVAAPVRSEETQDHLKPEANHTYSVASRDLLKSFGLQRGDAKDPRIGQKVEPPVRYMRKWE